MLIKELHNLHQHPLEESANLTVNFGVSGDSNAGKLCIDLARAGLTVDMEEAMDIFYFNFKNEKDCTKAKAIAKKNKIVVESK